MSDKPERGPRLPPRWFIRLAWSVHQLDHRRVGNGCRLVEEDGITDVDQPLVVRGAPFARVPRLVTGLRAARRRAVTRSFQRSYRRWRPMVERSIAWLVADGCRRVPYRGIQRNQAWWSLRVAAVNLRRLLTLGLARDDGAWVLA
jgi:Transposase DDE domain